VAKSKLQAENLGNEVVLDETIKKLEANLKRARKRKRLERPTRAKESLVSLLLIFLMLMYAPFRALLILKPENLASNNQLDEESLKQKLLKAGFEARVRARREKEREKLREEKEEEERGRFAWMGEEIEAGTRGAFRSFSANLLFFFLCSFSVLRL
jgi:actin-related protein 5